MNTCRKACRRTWLNNTCQIFSFLY